MPIKMTDHTGVRYGKLVVLGEADRIKSGHRTARRVEVRCDCGTVKVVRLANLRCTNKPTRTCSQCLTHHMTKSRTWRSWASMRARCNTPSATGYENYGGRGVTVCPQWATFKQFYLDMGDRPDGLSLDRINPRGNYEPSNCRWATSSEQNYNKRRHYGE